MLLQPSTPLSLRAPAPSLEGAIGQSEQKALFQNATGPSTARSIIAAEVAAGTRYLIQQSSRLFEHGGGDAAAAYRSALPAPSTHPASERPIVTRITGAAAAVQASTDSFPAVSQACGARAQQSTETDASTGPEG